MPKPLSIKVNDGQLSKLARAVDDVREHYGPLLSVWRGLPDAQRQRVLAGSPLLARLLEGVL